MELSDLQKQIILDLINNTKLGDLSEEVILAIVNLRSKVSKK